MAKQKKTFAELKNAASKKQKDRELELSYANKALIKSLLPFKPYKIYKENHSSLNKFTFLICALFTSGHPKYFQYADRLAKSCEQYDLPYSIFEIPTIHKSISLHGQDDLTFTKANFIYFNMLKFPDKNILYMDTDTFFVDVPNIIIKISKHNYDFAIYNWLNDKHNETYLPKNGRIDSDFYIFSHDVSYYCSKQLICSGVVQFYGNSVKAKYLLDCWQTAIANNPGYPDDECLDYAFNNFFSDSIDLKTYWFDKAYLRYPWWPHIKPVILHPDVPAEVRQQSMTVIGNRKRFYRERCHKKTDPFLFPPDCIIDTKNRLLLRYENEKLIDTKQIEQYFWIYSDENNSLFRQPT